ncbi:T9SS type A sorting domain-containing protein [Neolewinella aurantiaca]|uniref:T9SS type A sorting domain-containing protein n=1 Tax=Neolewinella aurantiaca TaxID=2602767 RepID=A0A5C7FWY0_9BACT|nr:T9SS type A sorting domain-containing protein [Neolewinella aurantiaca]TXF89411.1 T9SS type A sorting domain-containing protein [Neolewinella aurantiaca]
MRYFFLLLLVTFLCTCGRAQVTVTASIALADDQCNPVINDPNTDCISVPAGNDMLSYLPGQDGDIIITYRLTNNTAGTITQASVTDSDRGSIVPVSVVNIPPGTTVTANRIYPAETTPRTVTPTVTANVENSAGASLSVTNDYTLDVVAPEVSVEFGVARQADVCDNEPTAPNCPVPYGALNGQTVTIGALDTFTTRFAWTNSGLSTFDMENLVDQDDFQIANTGFDQEPGQTLISSRHWEAPAAPGTYNYSQTLTVTDMGGNVVTETVTFIVIVEAPMVEVEFGVARQADVCDNEPTAPNCPVPYGALNGQTVTVGALDTFTTRFAWTNSGLGAFDMENLVDQDGFEVASTGFDQEPGQTLISSRHWEAPAAPGTYNYSQTLTATDMGGNVVTETVTFIVIVEAPMVEVEFGVARQADVCDNEPTAPNCPVPYGALTGQTVTVGALDTFTTRFAWTNSGLGTFDMENLVDQDGFEVASTGFNQEPGQTLISSRHWEAPAAPGIYNYSQTLTATDMGGNVVTETVTFIVIVEAPMVEVEFGVARQADVCDNEPLAPVCPVSYGALNGQTVTVGALDTFTTRFAWTNSGLGTFDMENLVDQDGFEVASTGFNQEPGQTLISSRHWEAPAAPGTYNYSQTLTATDMGGNVVTEAVTFIVIVEAPMVEVEFGVANQNDVCPDEPVAPNCPVPYGPLNGQMVTVGAGDTLTTRYAWTNTGLGEYDLINIVDQDNFQVANTGFDQQPGQTLISSRHWPAPAEPGIYDWSQTLTITDKGGNTLVRTVTFKVQVDCNLSDIAPPTALCRDRSFTVLEGTTLNINPSDLNDGSFDGCGPIAGGSIDISSFTCADEGINVVTLTVGDSNGNLASCTSDVTINVEGIIYEGINNDCESSTSPVTGGQAWQDILSQDGQVIAQVIIGSNTNIAAVRATVYKSAEMTELVRGQAYLSKRINLEMLDAGDNVVQPNTDPIYVRLYYTEAEIAALTAASPGSSPATFTVFKTSDTDCGAGYSGANALGMNTSFHSTGCTGEDAYLEFFTGQFSTFYLFATEAILPVEMTSFEAHADDKQRAVLNWSTATESGSSRFDVEHSSDGRTFRYVGAVAGAGESYEERRYEYLHPSPVSGINYYRLRQVDLDGTETLSDVREVTITGPVKLVAYPNPATDILSLRGFTGGSVSVVDMQGRTVLRTTLSEFGSLNVAELATGVYLLRTGEESIRWIKQ